jgi:hypothetical protein
MSTDKSGMIVEGSETEFKNAKASLQKTGSIESGNRRLPKIGGMDTLTHRNALHKVGSGYLGAPANGADVSTTSPEIRNPLLNLINFSLPFDRRTLNQWIRYYQRFHPYVNNCIDLHATFPISDWKHTGITDKKILDIYEEQKERADILEWCFDASKEYELIGEAFSFWNWDDEFGIFDSHVPLNPDLLEVQTLNWGSTSKAVYVYDPPTELKALVHTRDEYATELLESLDPVVLESIMAGKKIPLNEFNVVSLLRKASPYESRGTSVILSIIKDLMYEDKLREAQYAIADQQITPVQIWKLGDPASGYMPTESDLHDFRTLLQAGAHDPLFTLVSHAAVNLELVGYTGKLLPVIPEFEFVHKRILVGLFTSDAMITGGSSTYSNAVVGMKALQGRYQTKRDMIVKAIKRKIYTPLAEAHEFFETTPAELNHRIRTRKKLILPGIEWNFKLDLTDQTQRIQYIIQLADKLRIPMKTVCECLDLPYDHVKGALKDEEGTVFDGVYQDVRKEKAKISIKAGGAGMPDIGGGGGMGGVGGMPSVPEAASGGGGEDKAEAAPVEAPEAT